MGLRIRTNVASLNAQRTLSQSTGALEDNITKLSSGYRINKAADDAAGLAISEGMKASIRSLDQAKRNANDGVSLVQVAEGSFNEVSNILVRLRELATQAASDTIGNKERSFANREYVQLVNEVQRISNTSQFNGWPLLGGQEALPDENMFTIHVGMGTGEKENTDTLRIGVENLKVDVNVLGLGTDAEVGPVNPDDPFDRATAASKLETIDNALQKVASNRSFLGAQQSRLNSTINNLGVQIENLKSANSRIRDVDFASETASLTQNRILQQAGMSVLAQANSGPEIALALLRS
ncbi:MAG: flagellin FliC [Deltaproteobacteria bacterium]|nr:flagellin FliC [Deltaproteobacteria bacterium]